MMDYVKLAQELGELVSKKQEAYGDSFGKSEQIFKILYPNGVKPENYGDFLALVRIVDKMFRIATKKDAFGENPFMDIEGYALLARAKNEPKEKSEEPSLTNGTVSRIIKDLIDSGTKESSSKKSAYKWEEVSKSREEE
jgi:hypothetical protein